MSVIWSPFLLLYQNTFTCFCYANFVMPLDVFRYSPSLRKWPCLGVFHGTCPQGVFGHSRRFPALHAWQTQALQQTCKCLPAAPDWMDAICGLSAARFQTGPGGSSGKISLKTCWVRNKPHGCWICVDFNSTTGSFYTFSGFSRSGKSHWTSLICLK